MDNSDCRFEIEFLSGPNDGEVKRLYAAEAIVGSEKGVDVLLASDTAASSRHARIRLGEGDISIEDLGSGKGTTVNGKEIAGRKTVGQHDIVCVGNTEFLCRVAGSQEVASNMATSASRTRSGT